MPIIKINDVGQLCGISGSIPLGIVKRFIASILIVLLTLQSFTPLVVYTSWYANRNYVAAVLCENKSKPQLHCDGKCVLMKKLQQAEEEENAGKSAPKPVEAAPYVAQAITIDPPVAGNTASGNYPRYMPDNYTSNYHSSCFRPPCA